jgi:FkbM family methyltransferase
MNIYLKSIIKKIIYKFGFDLYRFSPSSSPQMQINSLLKKEKINIIFDIGSNIGQFAKDLRSAGYADQIVSFEPLSTAHEKLIDIAKKDKKWFVHDQGAIGAYDGKITINISKNLVSSSILPIKDTHLIAAPSSEYISSEIVLMYMLDSISEQYLKEDSRLFIKIDVQGSEWNVLDGAKNTILKARGIICELSLVPLYNNQRLWREIVDRLDAEGFMLWALQRGLTDKITGQTLQMDGIFLRRDKNNL